MSSDQDFISQVCNAFRKAVESASGVTLEGREREFRRILTQYLFDELLGWKGYSKIGEIYDIACFDDEDFPIVITETKWGVELTREIKEKLRRRIEELGSVKYGVFASERQFVIYAYEDYKLRDVAQVNVAEAVGVAKGEGYGLSEVARRRVLKLEQLKRGRLVWIEDPDYFERTYKEISVVKKEGVELLTENLKSVVGNLTSVLMNFFDSYWKRKEHYSGRFLENTFNDWLRLSMKSENFKKGNENERRKIVEVFCRETAYVLIGKILFTRICEDKDITKLTISGKGLAESVRYYEKRRKKPYLIIFDESREKIRKYYTHLYKLGYFDWWWISLEKIGVLRYEDKRIQNALEEDLNDSIKKMFRRFNRFDFTLVDRDILGDVYQGYLPPNERKQLGEFYTPKEVIEYILDAVGYKPQNEIRGKKILDPACGSGSFLVEATQRLIERYRRIGFNLKDPDEAKEIIEECIGSIYGLDIHPFACFIAEINLLFQLVDLYDTVRQKFKHYELSRINVYRTDSLAYAGAAIKLAEFFDNSRRKMLIEETKGAEKVKKTPFDFVVGNPPYVNFANVIKRAMSLKITATVEFYKTLLKKYRKKYKSAFWNFDIYFLFLEKGLNWLEDKGKLGFICSNQFMTRYYGKKLRKFLLENSSVRHIVDFGDSGVFKEATNYPCILILEKQGPVEPFKCVRVNAPKTNILHDIKSHIHFDKYEDEHYEIFTVIPSSLKVGIWLLAPPDEVKLIEKIENASKDKLSDLCQITTGLRIGEDGLFIVQQTRIIDNFLVEVCPMQYKKEMKTFIVERALLKPILKGENIRRWNILWRDLYVIFPHKEEADQFVSIKESTLKDEYPNVYKYFATHRGDLENRSQWGKSPVDWHGVWYAIMTPGKPEYYKGARILTPALTNTTNFSLSTSEQCFVGGTAGALAIIPKDKELTLHFLGLLNSNMFEFYLKQRTPIKSGAYFQFSKDALKSLPTKLPRTDIEKDIAHNVGNLVDQILGANKRKYYLVEKVKQFPTSYFEDNWSFEKLANIAKVHLSKSSYRISEKTIRTYPFKELEYPFREVFRIILATKEHIDFYSEEVASYVLGVLKTMSRITKRELLELKIPEQLHLKNLMFQYRNEREKIIENEKAVMELEKQIDDLVYRLYDITHRERRIIEKYLARS